MRTSSAERIREMTDKGYWGTERLHDYLRHWADTTPDAMAVIDQVNKEELSGLPARRITFAELEQLSEQLAAELLAAGLNRGDRLMVQLPNISELVMCYHACSKLGVVISPLPVQYGKHELGELGAVLQAKAILTLAQFRDQALAAQAAEALPGVKVLTLGVDVLNPDSTAEPTALPADQVDANDVLTICWTSGTTGTPKGVPRSHNMWFAICRNTMAAGSYVEGEILLAPFPLINMAGLSGFLIPAAVLGATLVLHHPMDVPLYLQQLQEEKINFTIAPPALLNKLAQQKAMWSQFDFSALRAVGSGSVPLSPAMIEVFEQDYGKQIINFYGSNEGIALFSTPESAPDAEYRAKMFPRLGIAGMPWSGYSQSSNITRVIDPESGEEITEANVPGELCIGGPAVFDGYLEHDGEGLFTADGLFRTGDLVEICGEPPNYYRIVGRCKDIINRGGMKISPTELDTLLEGSPDLAEAAVCAYPDDMLGEKICACVVPAPDQPAPTLAAICDWLQARGLAKFKLPERLLVLDALPRNPVGKVVRSELQALATRAGEPS